MSTHPTYEITRQQYQRMDELQQELLTELEELLHDLETRVPLPTTVGMKASYRYLNPSDQQACVMALARILSSLHAQRLLLKAGLVQDLEVCSQVFNEMAEHVRTYTNSKIPERSHDHTGLGYFQLGEPWLEPGHLMATYMEPGPRFQIKNVIASPIWYQRYYEVFRNHCELIELFNQTAVYFGHPGMRQYVEDSGRQYLQKADAMRIFNNQDENQGKSQ